MLPDMVPLDFGIWGYFESKACVTPHPNVDTLKASIKEEWAVMSRTSYPRSTVSSDLTLRRWWPPMEGILKNRQGRYVV